MVQAEMTGTLFHYEISLFVIFLLYSPNGEQSLGQAAGWSQADSDKKRLSERRQITEGLFQSDSNNAPPCPKFQGRTGNNFKHQYSIGSFNMTSFKKMTKQMSTGIFEMIALTSQ